MIPGLFNRFILHLSCLHLFGVSFGLWLLEDEHGYRDQIPFAKRIAGAFIAFGIDGWARKLTAWTVQDIRQPPPCSLVF
jgi:hypothetical protein